MARQRKRPVAAPGPAAPAKGSPASRLAVRLPNGRVGVLRGSGAGVLKSLGSFTSFPSSILGVGNEKFETDKLARPYEQSDWVFACVSLIQDAFAELPLRVYPEDPLRAKEEVEPLPESDPLARLFLDWNPLHNAALANTAIAQGLCLDGEIGLVLTAAGGERLEVFGQGPGARIAIPEEIWPVAGPALREKVNRSTQLIDAWTVVVSGRPLNRPGAGRSPGDPRPPASRRDADGGRGPRAGSPSPCRSPRRGRGRAAAT